MERTSPVKMDTAFFMRADRDRKPVVVELNKFAYGLYVPLSFESGEPNWEELIQIIEQARKGDSEPRR